MNGIRWITARSLVGLLVVLTGTPRCPATDPPKPLGPLFV